jgi:glutaredoxin
MLPAMRTRATLRALPGLWLLSASVVSPTLPATTLRPARTPALLLALLAALAAAGPAQASLKVLSQARSELQRGRLVDVLTLLRPDEGNLGKADGPEAARLLAAAARKAVELKRPELALQLAEASFDLDAGQPQVLALLGEWALADGRVAQAKRYAEIWSGVAPQDPAAQAFHERARGAKPPAQASVGGALKALFRGDQAGARKNVVTLYTTSWCPACKRAKLWLKLKRVAFVEKDVEKDPAARSELMAEAEKQGVGKRGVPVLDAYGKLAEGFSEKAYAEMLKLEE